MTLNSETTVQPSAAETTVEPSVTETTVEPSVTETTVEPSVTETTVQPSAGGADHLAAVLAEATPSAAGIAALDGIDPATLSPAGLIDLIAAWHRVAAWVAGRQTTATALLAQADEHADLELACALHLSAHTAYTMVADAETLTAQLPDTLTALTSGNISARHAAAIAQAIRDNHLDNQAATLVEQRALRRAGIQDLAHLRRTLDRAVATADPDAAARRHTERRANPRIRIYPAGDGMAVVSAELEAVTAAKTAALVTDRAKTLQATDRAEANTDPAQPKPVRSLNAARADAIVELIAAGHTALTANPDTPKTTVETSICITVPAAVLLDLTDDPGELSGHGPITAGQVRQAALAAGTTWRRIVCDDSSGAVLDVGRTRYRPTAVIADTVRATHPRCLFPSCHRPATDCDLDHRDPYDRTGNGTGGTTATDNLGPLCRRHHLAKTFDGWTWHTTPDGEVTWTSPTGHRYTKATEPLPV